MRKITKRQEQCYRLISSDFQGLTTAEAAQVMGITTREVQLLLSRMKERAPQLFPIMTKQEAQVLHHMIVDNWKQLEIAEHLQLTEGRISQIVANLRQKGKLPPAGPGRALSYEPSMDHRIRQKF